MQLGIPKRGQRGRSGAPRAAIASFRAAACKTTGHPHPAVRPAALNAGVAAASGRSWDHY
jgi:hypothetical protein